MMNLIKKIKSHILKKALAGELQEYINQKTEQIVKSLVEQIIANNRVPLLSNCGLSDNPVAISHAIYTAMKKQFPAATCEVFNMGHGNMHIQAGCMIDNEFYATQFWIPIKQESDVTTCSEMVIGMLQKQASTIY